MHYYEQFKSFKNECNYSFEETKKIYLKEVEMLQNNIQQLTILIESLLFKISVM